MAQITHQFQSTIPDSPDPTLVQPSNWNDAHTIDATGVLIGNNSSSIDGVSASSRFQFMRRNNTNSAYEFSSEELFSTSWFNFSPIAPNVSLTGGSPASVSINPNIPGISTISAGIHRVRIIDSNPALNEVVLLTAGTTAGTLVFTPANSHTAGSYTIVSATAGIQESVVFVAGLPDGGSVKLNRGNTVIYATITSPGSPYVGIIGDGPYGSVIIMDSSMTNQDAFFVDSASALVGYYGFTVGAHANHSAGFAIHIKGNFSGSPEVCNIYAVDTYGGLWLEGSDNVQVYNWKYFQQTPTSNPNATYGIRLTGGCSQINFVGGRCDSAEINSATILRYGIMIEAADGLTFTGFHVRADVGVQIDGSGGGIIGSAFFTGNVIDTCRTSCVTITGVGAAAFMSNIKFANNHIISGLLPTSIPFYVVSDITKPLGLSLVGNIIANGWDDNVYLLNVYGAVICGNDIRSGGRNGGATTAGIRIVNGKDISITGGFIGDQGTSPTQKYGIVFGGSIESMIIDGVTLRGNVSAPFLNIGTITNSLTGINFGMTNSIPLIASGSTVSYDGFSSTIRISGSATIDNLNGVIGSGQTLTIISTGTWSMSATGNIGRAIGPVVSGQVLYGVFSGPDNKWYFE